MQQPESKYVVWENGHTNEAEQFPVQIVKHFSKFTNWIVDSNMHVID